MYLGNIQCCAAPVCSHLGMGDAGCHAIAPGAKATRHNGVSTNHENVLLYHPGCKKRMRMLHDTKPDDTDQAPLLASSAFSQTGDGGLKILPILGR